MYVYRKARGEDLYTVGAELPTADESTYWTPIYDCASTIHAMELISYLNGGQRPVWLREAK
jgi:hypothetical protein